MKNIIIHFILMVGLIVYMSSENQAMGSTLASHPELVSGSPLATATYAGVEGGLQIAFEQTDMDNEVSGNFFLRNWGALAIGLLGFFDLVVRLTPTTKDNSIVNFLTTVMNAIIPNFKKGGGVF